MNGQFYMAVTADEYELPLSIADTEEELAKKLRMKLNTVKHIVYQTKKGQQGTLNNGKTIRIYTIECKKRRKAK